MSEEQIKNIIRYGATMVVFIAGMFGIALDEDTAQVIVIGVAMVALCAYGLWKNHNLTTAAIVGQKVIDAIKDEVVTEESVVELLDSATGKHAIQD